MKLGIIGLPNVGKSTLFNALTKAGAAVANYPFCTIEPNTGVVPIPDDRLYKLARLHASKKITHATINFLDIAGLVKGASKGEGLGNKFLSHVRSVDALVHVVRCFANEKITHVSSKIDPISDIDTINTELCLADLESLSQKMEKTKTAMKSGDKRLLFEYDTMKKAYDKLEQMIFVRSIEFSKEELAVIKQCFLLTSKKVLYIANISENNEIEKKFVESIENHIRPSGDKVIAIGAQIESELINLEDEEERLLFLDALGLEKPGLERLISASYNLLGLMSFITTGENETRAWTIPIGTPAVKAAGKIHTDFERGFIRAEVINWEDLLSLGGYVKAKEKGKIRSEGKEYIIKEGEVVLFRFNV